MNCVLWVITLLLTTYTCQEATGKQLPMNKVNDKDYKNLMSEEEMARAVRESIRQHELKQQRNKHVRSKRAVKSVCYNELGCFEDSGPFAYLEMLPSPPEEINTKFYFYSTRNRSERPLIELPFLNMTAAFARYKNQSELTTEGILTSTTTVTSRPNLGQMTKNGLRSTALTLDELGGFDELSVRVIVHGFGSACPHVWIYEMKTALMAVEDCIVICVDWENGATFPNYVRAAANTRLVGKQLALLLQNLKQHKGLNFTRTHLIGFSLGAHASGFAGAELPGLSRITGLDPAGPLFEAQHPKVRLDSNDAEFVDVIHSNGENLILGGLGSWQPMGDVDFYPNGGRVQTGCSNLFVGAVTDFIWSGQTADEEEGRSLCNHRRAYKFFIDSVAPRCLFPAYPCASYDDFLKGKCFPCAPNENEQSPDAPKCGNMGYYADRSTGRGQLYLLTRDEEPFCAHQFQLQIFNSFNDLPLRTIGRLEAILEGDVGLNETFKISEKDDAEFFAGDIVSKIIVPHPALGFPTTLSLNYKSYSGWLSKGLPHWDIDKVALIDSFGRSHSICQPIKLASGSPVRLKLQGGDCKLDNQDEYGAHTRSPPTEGPEPAVANSDFIEHVKSIESVERKDLLNLGTKFKLTEQNTYALDENQNLPWQPMLEGNALDKESQSESSRSFSEEPQDIFEPVLKDRRLTLNSGRNIDAGYEEIMEPVLKATTPKAKKAKEINFRDALQMKTTTNTASNNYSLDLIKIKPIYATDNPRRSAQMAASTETPLTVQILPFRLGELLQRAERYARETLLPLISVQAPRFFGFKIPEESKSEMARKPRYIPRFTTNSTNSFLSSTKSNKTIRQDVNKQLNIFDMLHQLNTESSAATKKEKQQSSLKENLFYYTNIYAPESRALKPESPEYKPIFIDLPTYKPVVQTP